ncbi:AraC family transcriptional regulator ligand-binding domain-containing protein [Streptomyces erythrochromogenes]|uniref:AraC family transcriptional regulator n=1 Tax=Streptomyces erythrochromogenes TaxID=285574 RepID=UPI00368B2C48
MHPSAINGTVSAHLTRSLVAALADPRAGGLSRLPDLGAEVLGDDRARISTASLLTVWENLVLTEPHTLIGPLILEEAPIGAFGLWDYLITSGPTLRESLAQAVNLIAVVGDPAAEKLVVEEGGGRFTVRHATGSWGPDVVEAVDLFALSLFLTRARSATGRDIVPSRVTVTHRAPRRSRQLARLFGTDRIHFGAPYNSISFTEDDVRVPLPRAQPGVDRILAQHAELVLAASRPVLGWLDRFRAVLTAAFRDGTVGLEEVACRLAVSPRTLQRRLSEHDTTWREQTERVRHELTLDLLHSTDLPLRAVAGRVGYSDVRVLRRAVRRWSGTTPGELRKAAPADRTG